MYEGEVFRDIYTTYKEIYFLLTNVYVNIRYI